MPFSEDEGRRVADAGAAGAGQAFTPRQRHCDFLELWRRCPGAACRRAHSCAGVPGACFHRAYAGMSEIARLWAAAGIVALDRGASRRAAALAADSRVLSHLREREGLPRTLPRRRLWRRVKAGEGGDAPRSSA